MKTLQTFLIATIISTMSVFAQVEEHGLKDVFPFKLGNILNGTTVNNSKMKDLVLKEFNSITPENELKPNATMVLNGSTNDNIKVQLNSGAQRILKFCEDNNIPLRGHTLVWHNQTPPEFFRVNFSRNGALVDKETMNMRMESYIKNIFALIKERYPNLNLYAYDVVNEAHENWGGKLRPANESSWTTIYGNENDEYIINAFTYARKYAPKGCKLFYNDYNEYETNKCNSIYKLAIKLRDLGIIDGIGMQSHLDLPSNPHSVGAFANALKKFASTGLEVQITEIDITIPNKDKKKEPTVSDAEAQGRKYRDIMKEVLKYQDQVTAFVVWGIQDNQSWRGGASSENRFPVLWDGSGNKKPAYHEIFALGTPPTSNSEIQFDNPLKAWINDGQLNVASITVSKPWRVYTTTGMLVHQGVALSETATATINMPGVYIVWAENGTAKVSF